jgi:hypothetical protein
MTVPLYNLTDTWNNGATAFTAIQMNVTNTASAAGSKVFDFQVGGNSVFDFDITTGIMSQRNSTNAQAFRVYNTFTDSSNYERGVFDWTTSSNILTIGVQWLGSGQARDLRVITGSNYKVYSGTSVIYEADGSNSYILCNTAYKFNVNATSVRVDSGHAIGWTFGNATSALDTGLSRDAAGIIGQRNSTNAQTFRVYNTFTDASNYERGIFDWTTTANVLTIGSEVAGTGTPRPIQFKARTSGPSTAVVLDYGVNYTATWTIPGNSQMSFEGGGQGVIYMRAGASNYGEIANINSTTWMLGYIAATPSNGLGTEVVSWTNLDSVVCNHHAISTSATDGFLYIATCAGTPTGVPTTFTGRVPMVYDTTNNKFYIYNSGWKGGTNPGVFT